MSAKLILILTLARAMGTSAWCQNYAMGPSKGWNAEERQARYKHFAMSADTHWKMRQAVASLTDEDLQNCDSCTEIKEARNNATKKASKDEKTGFFGFGKKNSLMQDDNEPNIKKIYYINLEGSYAKKGQIEAYLINTAKDVPFERWAATRKDEATDEAIAEFAPKGDMQYLKNMPAPQHFGTRAVYLSQVRLLKHIMETDPEGTDWYIIMEDDAVPNYGDWVSRMKMMLKNDVPEDVDIFKFGYWGNVMCANRVNDKIFEPRAEPGAEHLYAGNQAYAIRPKSIPKILSQLKDLELYDIDGAMGSMHEEWEATGDTGGKTYGSWGLVQYVSEDKLIHHRNDFSEREMGKSLAQLRGSATEGAGEEVHSNIGQLSEEARKEFSNTLQQLRQLAIDKKEVIAQAPLETGLKTDKTEVEESEGADAEALEGAEGSPSGHVSQIAYDKELAEQEDADDLTEEEAAEENLLENMHANDLKEM